MTQPALGYYGWAVPSLLISVWMAYYAGVGNAAKENTTISSNPLITTTINAAVHLTEAKSLHPFVSQTPDKEKAKEGETIMLGCRFHNPHRISMDQLTVKWFKEDEKGQRDLMENNVTVLENYTRAVMVGNLSDGNASLTILNVTANDHGTYYCQVILPSGEAVTGSGTKLRIRRSLGLFGIEESIGTIIGVVAAGIGGLVVLIVVLTPQLKKCLSCGKESSEQGMMSLLVVTSLPGQHFELCTGLCDRHCSGAEWNVANANKGDDHMNNLKQRIL